MCVSVCIAACSCYNKCSTCFTPKGTTARPLPTTARRFAPSSPPVVLSHSRVVLSCPRAAVVLKGSYCRARGVVPPCCRGLPGDKANKRPYGHYCTSGSPPLPTTVAEIREDYSGRTCSCCLVWCSVSLAVTPATILTSSNSHWAPQAATTSVNHNTLLPLTHKK